MSRLEFEKQFEKELGTREISPSAESWGKLQYRLEKNKSRKYPFWISIAATIIGGILILGLFFNQKEYMEPVKVVEVPTEANFNEKMAPVISTKDEIAREEPEIIEKGENQPKIQTEMAVSEAVLEEKTQIAENVNIEPVLEEKNKTQFSTFSASTEIRMQQKLEEILTEVALEENQDKEVSDSEIDNLLAQAALELSLEKNSIFAENRNAGELLYEVEMELEQSFRAKIFEVLKEGFEKTRTAVANRY